MDKHAHSQNTHTHIYTHQKEADKMSFRVVFSLEMLAFFADEYFSEETFVNGVVDELNGQFFAINDMEDFKSSFEGAREPRRRHRV